MALEHTNKKKYLSDQFDLQTALHRLRELLPDQATLKDFVHHNPLHSFQDQPFQAAIQQVNQLFGYQVTLSLENYRERYRKSEISADVVNRVLQSVYPDSLDEWTERLLFKSYEVNPEVRVGRCRKWWRTEMGFNLDDAVHPRLFRLLNSFLDQGIAIWHWPNEYAESGLLQALRDIDNTSLISFFRTPLARTLLHSGEGITELLSRLVGTPALFEQYLFDQQFSHPGWSGMVAHLERNPEELIQHRVIRLTDLIVIECLLEIDALQEQYGDEWSPIGEKYGQRLLIFPELFAPAEFNEYQTACYLFQLALEWSYYDPVLYAMQQQSRLQNKPALAHSSDGTFQGIFCIDDRCESIRRYLEQLDRRCETFGTPGFFGLDAAFQPQHSHFHSKICPGAVTPEHLITEDGAKVKRKLDFHHSRHSTNLLGGFLITHTLGFWSAIKLFANLFQPQLTAQGTNSFLHMRSDSSLQLESENNAKTKQQTDALKHGYTLEEMVARAEGLLTALNLKEHFASIVYLIGHGASSSNNPYYAAYDCGACSGRPGSVNARAMAEILNKTTVRQQLADRGILIDQTTCFIAGLHDTTRDEIQFYDVDQFNLAQARLHQRNTAVFAEALKRNAAERARRFQLTEMNQHGLRLHEAVKARAFSVFEPRPEYNHATNALTIIARRQLTRRLFLDRRAFLNSYDWQSDQEGVQLLKVLKAATPVSGGINLEYYFSRVDPANMGAGSKLPHNVMGLIGVANGVDGDLRSGLPAQMTEIHDPLRMLVIIEHIPAVVLDVLKQDKGTYQWFENNWLHLVVLDPRSHELFHFSGNRFDPYSPLTSEVDDVTRLYRDLEQDAGNLPICTLD